MMCIISKILLFNLEYLLFNGIIKLLYLLYIIKIIFNLFLIIFIKK